MEQYQLTEEIVDQFQWLNQDHALNILEIKLVDRELVLQMSVMGIREMPELMKMLLVEDKSSKVNVLTAQQDSELDHNKLNIMVLESPA